MFRSIIFQTVQINISLIVNAQLCIYAVAMQYVVCIYEIENSNCKNSYMHGNCKSILEEGINGFYLGFYYKSYYGQDLNPTDTGFDLKLNLFRLYFQSWFRNAVLFSTIKGCV